MSDSPVCTPEQIALSGSSGFYCYTRRQNVGLVVVVLAGFVSLIALVYIFGFRILRNVIRAPRYNRQLIKSPMDLLLLSLFSADLFQSLGVILNIRWIDEGVVRVGSLCTAQGILQNLGQAGVAMTTLIITLHTFYSLWRGKPHGLSLLHTRIIVAAIWIFLILFVSISAAKHREPSFYAPTPYWCWINSNYSNSRNAVENVWLWLAFTTSALYIPLFLYSMGYITPRDPSWWTFETHWRKPQPLVLGHNPRRLVSPPMSLIICALAFCLPVFPTSLARWFLVVHGDVKPFASAEAQFSVKAIFALSGLFDVLAFRIARPSLLLCEPDRLTSPAQSASGSVCSLQIEDTPSIGSDHNAATRQSLLVRLFGRNLSYILVMFWLIINALDALWILYYIRSATDPNPQTIVNSRHSGWQGYYVMMYPFGFLWGCVNILVWILYFPAAIAWPAKQSNRPWIASKTFRYCWYLVHVAVILPIAIILSLGPFCAPSIGVKIAQKQAWLHRCDSYNYEIILTGLTFNTPDELQESPMAAFYVRENGALNLSYYYNLTADVDDTNIWHFRFASPSISATVAQPLDISYQFANSTVSASCRSSVNETTQCMQGSFEENGFLSFSLNDQLAGTTSKLRAVDKEWGNYARADDAPSFILKQVLPDSSLGPVVLRTAVTQPDHCNSLKLCANNLNLESLTPLGLALLKQNEFSKVCTTPNSN
ncbi:hypothetical protein C8J56DRAFT_958806 [Mycena floridula]|nr:hypothetical protein C8J56DRAFT_958806 [Mycena floridula]